MADLEVQGDELVLRLTAAEKAESLHGDVHAPLSAVRAIEVLENAHRPADVVGFRVGTRIPGVVEVASVHGFEKKIFAAVHHATPRGVRVTLEGSDYDEWIVGCADPEGVVARLPRPG